MNNSKKIKLINIVTKNIIECNICINKEDDKCSIELIYNNKRYLVKDDNYFIAFNKLRNIIFPFIPLVKGALVNSYPSSISSMSDGLIIYENYILGKKNDLNIANIFDYTDDINRLTTPKIQKAFHKIWFFSTTYENIYNIELNQYVVIEKESKYKFLFNSDTNKIDKLKNKKYNFFWIYDKISDKVYDISSLEDIEKFKSNNLSAKWNSLEDFIKWYADEYMVD